MQSARVNTIHPGPIEGNVVVLDDARGAPWCEVGPVVGTPPDMTVHVYNSTSVDVCTVDRSDTLDPLALAAEFNVPKIIINPERFWAMDRVTFYNAGEVVDFDGVKAVWAASMTPEMVRNILGAKRYTAAEIKRDTEWFYRKGKKVYLLRAPEGKVWVLQVYSHEVDKNLSMQNMDQIGEALVLPEGWTFEVKVLEKDLSIEPRRADGVAYILRDNLANTYEGCGYDDACNYVP